MMNSMRNALRQPLLGEALITRRHLSASRGAGKHGQVFTFTLLTGRFVQLFRFIFQ